MTTPVVQMTRAQAFAEFDAAATAFEDARANSKAIGDRASELEAEARELRARASAESDRALLAYALTHAQLRRMIDLDRWNSERAEVLRKSAAEMNAIAAVGASK